MKNTLRRQLEGYELLSESSYFLKSLNSAEIVRVQIGLNECSLEDYLNKNKLSSIDQLIGASLATPVFITTSENTLVLNFDGYLRSIVVRVLGVCIDEDEIMRALYEKDSCTPYFLKVKSLVDISNSFDIVPSKISKVMAYKLPDNYQKKPIGYSSVNEFALVFCMERGASLAVRMPLKDGRLSPNLSLCKYEEELLVDPGDIDSMIRIF